MPQPVYACGFGIAVVESTSYLHLTLIIHRQVLDSKPNVELLHPVYAYGFGIAVSVESTSYLHLTLTIHRQVLDSKPNIELPHPVYEFIFCSLGSTNLHLTHIIKKQVFKPNVELPLLFMRAFSPSWCVFGVLNQDKYFKSTLQCRKLLFNVESFEQNIQLQLYQL